MNLWRNNLPRAEEDLVRLRISNCFNGAEEYKKISHFLVIVFFPLFWQNPNDQENIKKFHEMFVPGVCLSAKKRN